MAFPDYAVIEDFTGTNQNPISGRPLGWYGPFGFPTSGMGQGQLTGNAFTSATSGNGGSVTTQKFAADVQAYVTVPSLIDVGAGVYLWVRVQNPGTDNFSAYGVWHHRYTGGEYEIALLRDDLGSDTGLDAVFNASTPFLAAGDKIGISCIGTTITGYYFSGGSWNVIGVPHTDTTYGGACPVALFVEGDFTVAAKPTLDDLSAGPYASAPFYEASGAVGTPFWGG